MRKYRPRKTNTSWQNVHKEYSEKVGETGHYFHEHVILPKLKEILKINSDSKVLDLACGEGVLSRSLQGYKYFLGVDLSKSLIEDARNKSTNPNAKFIIKDVGKELDIEDHDFTHCTIVLALQNIENPYLVILNAFNNLISGGTFVIVINHPYFRIPKSTSWEVDKENGHQYRKVFRYLSPHKIRIDMHPGVSSSKQFTYSYHNSLADYTMMLHETGFEIEYIDEWISDKVSEGRLAETENFARKEFPMFMCLVCKKK
ncbi:MAG TPA: class I SAM-dependent methyltransferase [Candidatus Dojkabacteria bacterium]|nr:class I SAM-dependent methyltransferase [Candidatus Dojkabacteria bacterium]